VHLDPPDGFARGLAVAAQADHVELVAEVDQRVDLSPDPRILGEVALANDADAPRLAAPCGRVRSAGANSCGVRRGGKGIK
jgi:hypothetical protein